MYIVTIREKGKDKPLLERECECVLGAFGSKAAVHVCTHIKSDKRTLVRTYAGVLVALKALGTEFPSLVDEAVEAAKDADVVETETNKPHASLFSRLFGR